MKKMTAELCTALTLLFILKTLLSFKKQIVFVNMLFEMILDVETNCSPHFLVFYFWTPKLGHFPILSIMIV